MRLGALVGADQIAAAYLSTLSYRIELDYADRSYCMFANSNFPCHL